MKKIIEIDIVESGQSHPLSDGEWKAYISLCTKSSNGSIYYQKLTRRVVLGLARNYVLWFPETTQSPDEPFLREIKPVGPTDEMRKEADSLWPPQHTCRWFVHITQPIEKGMRSGNNC